jgi:sec-independent protein translocase protein TatC
MTFGEHLDELRWALIKAISALFLGVLVGLFFGGNLVDYIQTPLREALEEYYQGISTNKYRSGLEAARDRGEPVPSDVGEAAKEFGEEGLVAERRFIDGHAALEALAQKYPDAVDRDAIPPRNTDQPIRREDLVPIDLYHSIENDPRVRVIGLSVYEPFVAYMKASLVLGIIISSPAIFYFIWQFVAAGLFAHEKKYVYIFLPMSIGLFLAGALLAFFVVFDYILAFLFKFYAWMGIDPDPRLTDWLSFVLFLPLGFGISFQLPLVMLFLERIGVFSVASYLAQWRMAVLAIFVLSMILTPSDPYSMLLMAIPLTVLYFGGVLLCKVMPRRE